MIDWTKPVQTRDGRKVTIYCTDAPGYPVHGRVDGNASAFSWDIDGKDMVNPGNFDLINVPEEKYVWVNVYKDMAGIGVWPSRSEADEGACHHRIGRIKVKLEARWDE